jgi:16S rRNA (adenine1518-N6/adenine1519-N6)-dimethyltransferase
VLTTHVQTKREIQAVLSEIGVRPQRRFGQHFLIDGNLMRRLVESAELSSSDCVIEVGPGTGGLTDLVAASGARVIAVEIDRALYEILTDRFRDAEHVTLLFGDVLDGKHCLNPALAGRIHAASTGPPPTVPSLREGEAPAEPPVRAAGASLRTVKLVANLPYQVATPLIMNLLVDFPHVRRLCFTVQAEVGERITAEPGTKDFGPLSILCQSLCTITTIARIGPQCFWPVPHVDSVMLRLDVRERPLIPRDELPGFASFVRSVFDHRRKQLRTALKYVATLRADVAQVFDRDVAPVFNRRAERLPPAFDLSRRPEELAIDEWLTLFRTLPRSPRETGQG